MFEGFWAATFSPPSVLISATMTFAPSSAKRRAIAAPNPEPPPVDKSVSARCCCEVRRWKLTRYDGDLALESCALSSHVD